MNLARTLLLNSTYEPLRVISWRRAITMSYLGKVEVIRTYDTVVRSVSTRLETPAVVKLTQFVRRHRVRIAFSRKNVFLRDDHQCQYCSDRLPAAVLTTDHVIPRSRGGRTCWENVVTACGPCNRKKGNLTPTQARMKLRKQPSRPTRLPPLGVRLGVAAPPEPWREYLVYEGAIEAAS
jgi:5-methylcytosine-specific restriction endonuclease McrA